MKEILAGLGLGRMVTLSGIGLTLLLLLATVGNLTFEYHQDEYNAELQASNLVRALAAQTDAVVASIDQSLLRVLDAIGKRPLEELIARDPFHQLLVSLTDHVPYLRTTYVIDAYGKAIQSSRDAVDNSLNVSDREYFIAQRDNPDVGIFIGPPVIGRNTGTWAITLTRRIQTADGGFAGVVMAVLDADYLQELYNSIDIGRFGIVSLFLRDGRMLVRSPYDQTMVGKSLAQAPQFKAMMATGLHRGTDKGRYVTDGRVRISAFEFIKSGSLFLRVGIDESEALAGWRQAALLHVLGVTAFGGLLALLTRLMRVQLQRRERAEIERRESQRLATSTIDALTMQLCVLDEAGTIIVVNRAWGESPEILGATPRTPIRVGANYFAVCEAVTGDEAASAAPLAAGIRAVMAGVVPEYMQEYPYWTPGGQRWYVARVTRFDGSGPVRVVMVHRDITYRHKATQEVLREKERAETYLAISESIIVELDASGRIGRINPRGCEVLGATEGALIGRDWFDRLSPESAQLAARTLHHGITEGQAEIIAYYENEVVGRGGERRIIAWHATVLTAPNGRITGTLSSGQDVTERRRMEDNLRQSERRLAKAQTIARLGNWEADLQSGIVWWSREIYEIFGRGPREFAAGFADYLRFVDPDDRSSLHEQERQLVADGTPINVDHRIIHPDGGVRFVNLQADLITDADGTTRRAVGIVHDITERKRNEVELLHAVQQAAIANRTKTEFLANMSHELNTPLNAVIGFSEMIAEELCGPLGQPKYQEFGRIICEAGRHLQHIISDLLDLTKIDAGELEQEDDVISVSELVAERLRVLAPSIRTGNLTLIPATVNETLGLRADRRMVKQILHNLLSNAVKFTPSGGTVSVSAQRAADGRLCFSIVDTGVGMATEDIPRALDRFSQIDGSLARQHDGAGLGLSLAKLMIEQHGGTIDIISAVGIGTTIQVWFPRDRTLNLEANIIVRPHNATIVDDPGL